MLLALDASPEGLSSEQTTDRLQEYGPTNYPTNRRTRLSPWCAVAYGRIRADLEQAGICIGPNDLLIAATAVAHSATLVTSNVREFERVAGLTVENWAEAEF